MTSKLSDPTRHIDRTIDSDPDDDDIKLTKPGDSATNPKDEKFSLNLNASRYITSDRRDHHDGPVIRNHKHGNRKDKNYFANESSQTNLAELLTKQRESRTRHDTNKNENENDDNDDRDHHSQYHRTREHEEYERQQYKLVKVTRILLHPAMIGLYAAILIFILLVSIQPGFVMKSVPLNARTEEMAEPTQQHMLRQRKKINWITVTVVSLFTGLVVGLTPFLVDVITKSIKKKQQLQRSAAESEDHHPESDDRHRQEAVDRDDKTMGRDMIRSLSR